jgi:hypothetical protein
MRVRKLAGENKPVDFLCPPCLIFNIENTRMSDEEIIADNDDVSAKGTTIGETTTPKIDDSVDNKADAIEAKPNEVRIN